MSFYCRCCVLSSCSPVHSKHAWEAALAKNVWTVQCQHCTTSGKGPRVGWACRVWTVAPRFQLRDWSIRFALCRFLLNACSAGTVTFLRDFRSFMVRVQMVSQCLCVPMAGPSHLCGWMVELDLSQAASPVAMCSLLVLNLIGRVS